MAAYCEGFKSTLQEKAQHAGMGPIEYRITEERGPAHDREFVIEVLIGEIRLRHRRWADQEGSGAAGCCGSLEKAR